MARYQIPPDPRKPDSRTTSGRPPAKREPVPWFWLGMGIVVTIVGIGLAVVIARAFLIREPLAVTMPDPTIIRLTAPPTVTPSVTPAMPTPTFIPTFTPIPTPDNAVAPPEITPGFYARVANTGGAGVVIRGGPSVNNVRLEIAADGTILLVLDGPRENDDLIWWQVRLQDGTEGWAAADFLEPAPAPDDN